MDRNSAVGIATRYGLDGPGTESPRGRNFPHPSRPVLGPTQLPIQWVSVFPGGKAAGPLTTHPPHNAKVKERVELYLYSISEPSWSVIGWTLLLLFLITNKTLLVVQQLQFHLQCYLHDTHLRQTWHMGKYVIILCTPVCPTLINFIAHTCIYTLT